MLPLKLVFTASVAIWKNMIAGVLLSAPAGKYVLNVTIVCLPVVCASGYDLAKICDFLRYV